MSGYPPVKFPAGYASGAAIGYTAESGEIVLVGDAQPLPVSLAPAAAPESLSGTTSVSTLVGPYAPVAGNPLGMFVVPPAAQTNNQFFHLRYRNN